MPASTYRLALMVILVTEQLAAQDVDLRPTREKVEVEAGVSNELLAMRDGSTQIFYEAPSGWSVIPESPTKLVLRPSDVMLAEANILVRPGVRTRTTEELVSDFRRLLPPEAIPQSEVGTPQVRTTIHGAPAYMLSSRYKLADLEMTRSALFLHYQHASFVILLTSQPDDHDRLLKEFLGSFYTWYWEDGSHVQPATIIEKQTEEEAKAE